MEEQRNIRTIVYIVGCGHSGSTLLSMVLGATGESFTVGEIKFLTDYLRKENPDPYIEGSPCTCGVTDLRSCQVWKGILERFFLKTGARPEVYDSRTSRKEAAYNLLGAGNAYQLRLESLLLESIFEVSGRRFVIDVSKSVTRLTRLLRTDYPVKAIHVIRNPEGFSQSMSHLGVSVLDAYAKWLRYNIVVLCLRIMSTRNEKISWMIASYDRFAQSPEREASRICRFLGMKYTRDMIDYWKYCFHNIGGNPMRMNKEPIVYRSPNTSEPSSKILRNVFSPLSRLLTGSW